MASWWGELQRRNVLRVAMAYLVVAWLLLQVTNVVAPALKLPDWVESLVFWLLFVGLVPTLLLAWIFEWTPAGVVRDKRRLRKAPAGAVDEEPLRLRRVHRLDLAIIGVLLILLGWTWFARPAGVSPGVSDTTTAGPPPSDAAPSRSIAVMPFEAMSADPADGFFADGLTEEILNRLVGTTGLRVASRTSSFAYRDRPEDLRGIAAALGVEFVLEGSVRRDGDQLRITAQLIDGRDGIHVWSRTYQQRMSEIFSVQDTVARDVARQLALDLAPSRSDKAARTRDPQAMALYLQAKAAREEGGPDNVGLAMGWIVAATDSDPDFAEAHALQAIIEIDQSAAGVVADDRVVARARKAIDRALALAPESPVVQAAAGRVLMWEADTGGSFALVARARTLLQQAIPQRPDDIEIRLRYAWVLMQHGEFAAASAVLDPVVDTESMGPVHRAWLVSGLLQLGRMQEARRMIDRLPAGRPARHGLAAAAAGPDTPIEQVHAALCECTRLGNSWCYNDLAIWFFLLGDDEHAIAALEAVPEQHSANREIARTWAMQMRGDWEAARRYTLERYPELLDAPYYLLDNLADQAVADGNWPEALRLWKRIEPDLFEQPPRTDMQSRSAANVAYTLMQVDDRAAADRIWRMLDAHFDAEPSFAHNSFRSVEAVLAAHALGDREKARDRLQAAIDAGFRGERLFEYTIDKTPYPAGEAVRSDPMLAPLLDGLRARNNADLQRLHAHLEATGQAAVPEWRAAAMTSQADRR